MTTPDRLSVRSDAAPLACLIAVLITAALLACVTPLRAADRKPNVLFIISDDLGSQSLGCYGNTQCKTPNLDALAARGARFTRVYCQYPVCGPSRAALMSGMYAQVIGVTSNAQANGFTKRMGDRPTMAQQFRDHGYYTARVSKIYHMRVPGDITAGVDGPDHEASWTERFNSQAPEQWTEGVHEHLSHDRLKPDPNHDIHYALGYGSAFYVVRGASDGTEQADHKTAAKAVELLEKHGKDDKPFFLAVGLVRPHVPLVAPASFFEPYPAEEMKLALSVENDEADIPEAGRHNDSQKRGLDTTLKKQKVLEAYYAAVSYMDAQVGKILGALDRLGLRDNTIVVFTADHGYQLGEHELWQKMHLHEETTHIPLIVAAPGRPVGAPDALGQQIDIYPTLAELCGLPIPPHVQGKSLASVVNDPDHAPAVHESVYTLRNDADHMLRTDRWALIVYNDGKSGVELYDMEKDPHQFTNLAEDPQHKQVLDDMRAKLDAKLASIK
ncbi:MAG: sulfatase-like hydrolase/transferase [Phycisphaera sp.]|nr:sulfatase-like hydrolase/transferase [Phycisphaera sp.]